MGYLAMKVGDLDNVTVDYAYSSDTGTTQIGGSRTAESTSTYKQDFGVLQSQLTLKANLRHDELAAIAIVVLRRQWPLL